MPAPWLLTVSLGVVLLLPAAAALTAASRGRSGTISRSSRLGVHGRSASRSDAAFALANRVAAPVVTAGGAVLGLGALLVLALRLPIATTVVIFVVALVGGLALVVSGGVVGERAAAAVTAAQPEPRPAGCAGCACGAGGCGALTSANGDDAASYVTAPSHEALS